ncbi:MAG TPA: hypothetical protein VJ577_13505 [Burkholderiaceae bacterium]|nr:hypothetical protein [Burkholderiaceae bacterium]
MNNAVRVLTGVEGVSAVTASLFRNELSVQFDAQFASKQSLQAVLQGAGYGIETSNAGGDCGSSNCS